MKKISVTHSLFAGLLLIGTATLFSCAKSSTDEISATAPAFTWSLNGITYNADNDTAFVSGPFTIIAKKDETSPAGYKIFEINLSAFTAGPYTLTATGVNQVNYIRSTGVITSQSGTLNITANTGSVLSGNFTTTLTGGITMNGNFINVPVKP